MEYIRITNIKDPLFTQMHQLMQRVFPREEVLAFELWKEPLEDSGIRVFVAVHEGKVVGTTEYRYYEDFNVAMTDFTIIGEPGLGIGAFLWRERQRDLDSLAAAAGKKLDGMFAEIYDPYRANEHGFGGLMTMNPYVRREVLSHMGYKRLDHSYIHPSWQNDGEAVEELDLGFLPYDGRDTLDAGLAAAFLRRYYAVLANKPPAWEAMVQSLESRETIMLLPL
ncbi:GNAT family N-acetyltransferase [Paenibacillus sp. MMS18-CY102]|uniref:GNAT family N-acetyltransferase n=1 Tax=Paenibacillus sp. MMS18-CY102 TaxID=2682849 RepID=UPI0013654CDF|nr:GNAT family N-acetyltransferase [Paenibacillus sp. MMS18-CY102]MWC30373.1 GNAT family N-acetyltransferase [Paenibacillus sp. MMS18-CY102]